VLDPAAGEVVAYLLFVDEARLTDAVQGASGFAEPAYFQDVTR
jgi:hypothetical protein